MRLSSFDVNTTKGMLLALNRARASECSAATHSTVPATVASNAWSTLSSSSISRTQGFSYWRARNRGPALKNCWPCNSVCRDLPIDTAGFGLQFNAKPLQRLVEFPDGLLFVDALVALQAFHLVFAASATAYASWVLPLPAGPSSSNGFCNLAARYTVVVATESAR